MLHCCRGNRNTLSLFVFDAHLENSVDITASRIERMSVFQVRASATMVDTEVSAAMVSLVMKLSEVELRPLFLDLCEWKASGGGGYEESATVLSALDRRLSFYRVLDGLASALRVRLTSM